MGISKKLLAAALSIAVSCSAAAPSIAANAADYSFAEFNNSTISAESKEAEEAPFRVFDIYDAFLGGTTTTSTAVTTTTTPTTTATTTTTTTETSETTTITTTERTASSTTRETTTKPVTTVPQVTIPERVYSWGVDVSRYQGWINWSRAKAAGVDFAIVQAGYGRTSSQKDPYFDTNIQNAQAAGVACGAYWYSYATSTYDAALEAEACYQVIKNYKLTYPIYFDIEEATQANLSVATISAIVDTFCSALEAKGYFVGVYSYAYFLESRIYRNVLEKYDVWVAQYASSPYSYSGSYGMWQYSSSGWVDGIPYVVDLNHAYRNYPYFISPQTYSGVTETAAPSKTVTTTTTSAYPKKGIDVSSVQGDIDWKTTAASGVDFAIIRAGIGGEEPAVDERFYENIQNSYAANVPRGAYWHTGALTVDDALAEAELFYNTIKGYQFEYPLYLDLSDPVLTQSGLGVQEITDIAVAFCKYFEEKGYYIGITSYEFFLTTYIDPVIYEDFDVWVASHGVGKPDFSSKYGLWQYSGSGAVDGITGVTSLDYCYRDYPGIMKYYHLNGF